jgi:hypothetical protein
VLKKVFGLNGDEVAGNRGSVLNEKFNGLYFSPNIFRVINLRRIRWAGHEANMVERTDTYWILLGKPEGKR